MIEIINPGWCSIVVDRGRYGYADAGIPTSAALDYFSYSMANHLVGNEMGGPALEVTGSAFSLRFDVDVTCAVTGAEVIAYLDERPVTPWRSFAARAGSTLRVKEVLEGFRYYIGFSGIMEVDRVINSFSTNIECRFGGYMGRPLLKGDRIGLRHAKVIGERFIPEDALPSLSPPYVLRILEGPEMGRFTEETVGRLIEGGVQSWYTVSAKANRTGIRLEGKPLVFKTGVNKTIISEGVLPGTIQVPGDGLPIITLYERTIGGYARLALIVKADHDLLAQLKPKDKVIFRIIGIEEAERLWNRKVEHFYRALPQ
ncbi:MAG: KipI antagonist [Syntrophorhabdus sp. PtaU1.Bin002]|nr:MAG: KipI antagonist [Syntrophorhabdus sp. PtaU1.Bin002]